MPLVEIIVGEKTSDETLARGFDYVQQIGKIPIVVNDSRVFYTSRVFATYVMEGIAMLAEGVYLAPSAFEAGFVSAAHSDADVAATIAAADKVFAAWK